MQWKQMNWPILVDSLNLLGVEVVPITLAIDEYGIIRAINPEPKTIEETFLNQTYLKPADILLQAPHSNTDLGKLQADTLNGSAESWRAYADGLVLWGGPPRLADAINAYQRALGREPKHAPTVFRLGATFRKRYDSRERRRNDFESAVEHWEKELRSWQFIQRDFH